jgi:Cyclic nucleotide-binding domain
MIERSGFLHRSSKLPGLAFRMLGDMFTIPSFIRSRHRSGRRPDVGPLLRAEAFAHADHRRLADLAPHVDVLRLRPGETLASAGVMARELVIVLSGEAAAVHTDGRRSTLRPGAEVGGAELLAGGRHVATVVAVSEIEVLVVNGPAARAAHAEGTARFGRPLASRLRPRRAERVVVEEVVEETDGDIVGVRAHVEPVGGAAGHAQQVARLA